MSIPHPHEECDGKQISLQFRFRDMTREKPRLAVIAMQCLVKGRVVFSVSICHDDGVGDDGLMSMRSHHNVMLAMLQHVPWPAATSSSSLASVTTSRADCQSTINTHYQPCPSPSTQPPGR